MPANRRRTPRDIRRRSLGQNFLVDPGAVKRLIEAVEVEAGQLVVDVGAGRGVLALTLARAGARVVALERDQVWARQLAGAVSAAGLNSRVDIIATDFRSARFPDEPYRVVANPPFALTTVLMARLLDDPSRGPWRADLLVQSEVARKRAASPPSTLRSAAWAPWWDFEMGPTIPARPSGRSPEWTPRSSRLDGVMRRCCPNGWRQACVSFSAPVGDRLSRAVRAAPSGCRIGRRCRRSRRRATGARLNAVDHLVANLDDTPRLSSDEGAVDASHIPDKRTGLGAGRLHAISGRRTG